MKTRMIVSILASIIPLSANATCMTEIKIETLSYPSLAAVHLDMTQQALALKAIEACGGAIQVQGITDIQISISPALDGGRGAVGIWEANRSKSDKFNVEYDVRLIYPRIIALAKVACRDAAILDD